MCVCVREREREREREGGREREGERERDFVFTITNNLNTIIKHMPIHLFPQWTRDIYKYTGTIYAYIIYKKVRKYRQPYR